MQILWSIIAICLPLITCSFSSFSSSEDSDSGDDIVQATIPGKTSDTTLKPFELRRNRPESLLNYGFVLDTKEITPSSIHIENQKLALPKNVNTLLITLPERQGKKYRQDIQISRYLGAQTPEFSNLELKDHHIALFLQSAKTPSKATHGKKPRSPRCPRASPHSPAASRTIQSSQYGCEKEEEKPTVANNSSKKFDTAARKTLRQLFSKVGRPEWPRLAFGYVSSIDAKDGRVQVVSPLTQDTRKDLSENYFSLPYVQGDVQVAIKLQNQLISLTKPLEKSDKSDPNLVIELKVGGFKRDGSPIFPRKSEVKIRSATRSELKKIPSEIQGAHFNLFFKFIEKSSSASESEEFEKRSRKSKSRHNRHHRHNRNEESSEIESQ